MAAYSNEHKLICTSHLNRFIMQMKQRAQIFAFAYFWNSSPSVSSSLTVIKYLNIYI